MTDTILTNAQTVLAQEVVHGTVTVTEGRIARADQGGTAVAGAIDLGGDMLIPGLIELHTDNLQRHIQPRPRVDWPHAAAILAHDGELASTGITTVFDAMRVGSIPARAARCPKYARGLASEIWALRDAGALRINHYLHLRAEVCSETLIEEIEEFGADDRVGIVSLMDHSPGQRQVSDISKMKMYVQGKHSMTDAQFDDHVTNLKGLRARFGDAHEAGAVAAAKRFGAVLASHESTTAEPVATSAGYGIRLAELPTTAEAARACHDHGLKVMMGRPTSSAVARIRAMSRPGTSPSRGNWTSSRRITCRRR